MVARDDRPKLEEIQKKGGFTVIPEQKMKKRKRCMLKLSKPIAL